MTLIHHFHVYVCVRTCTFVHMFFKAALQSLLLPVQQLTFFLKQRMGMDNGQM